MRAAEGQGGKGGREGREGRERQGRKGIIKKIYMSPNRGSSFFLGEVTALGVLCCFALFVCLTLLASLFLPSHLSLKHVRGMRRKEERSKQTNNKAK